MARPSLSDPRYYFNRHESWLAFNRRVLEEALDEGNPLLERVKFLAITASNLDEFVEVRVAGLLQQVEHGNQLTGPDGLSPEEQLQRLAQGIAFVSGRAIRLLEPKTSSRPAARGHTNPFGGASRPDRARRHGPVLYPPGRPDSDAGDDRSLASFSACPEQGVVRGVPVAP